MIIYCNPVLLPMCLILKIETYSVLQFYFLSGDTKISCAEQEENDQEL